MEPGTFGRRSSSYNFRESAGRPSPLIFTRATSTDRHPRPCARLQHVGAGSPGPILEAACRAHALRAWRRNCQGPRADRRPPVLRMPTSPRGTARGGDYRFRRSDSAVGRRCFVGALPNLSAGLSSLLVSSPPSWMINGSAPSGAFSRAAMAASPAVSPHPGQNIEPVARPPAGVVK
jgi:hypothetical protein